MNAKKKLDPIEASEVEDLSADVSVAEEPPGDGSRASAPASDGDIFTDEHGHRWKRIHEKRGSGWIDRCVRVG